MEKDEQPTVPAILFNIARLLDTEVKNGRLEIPAKFGSGYCAGFVLNEHIRMLISNYELKEDLIVNNPDINTGKRIIFFKFQNIFPGGEQVSTERHLKKAPSVLIATSRVNTDELIAIHSNTATINIEVDANYLKGLLQFSEKTPVLQSLLENTQPLLFEELIYSSIQKVVDEMVTEKMGEAFKLFFLRLKAEELICRLLMELEKRDEKYLYPLNNHDIQTIYKVKEQLLQHLDKPPGIASLATYAGMSATKLKRLFKQIFGNSIFNYYQQFRMQEAARLLKEEMLSVADVGYKMGFTNLSHFARTFKEHIGMKPKQYSRS